MFGIHAQNVFKTIRTYVVSGEVVDVTEHEHVALTISHVTDRDTHTDRQTSAACGV